MLLVHVCLMFAVVPAFHVHSKEHTNIVIVGGTGDLARKYLWSSALDLYTHSTNDNVTFSLYAAARMPSHEGTKALNEITENLHCDTDDSMCEKLKPKFLEKIRYVQVKTDDQYQELCQNFSKDKEIGEEDTNVIFGQIFYLSVPSSAYESVAKSIHNNCHRNGSWTRVVMEKPFGSDEESARHQALAIGKYFSDDELYRVDHYLAKSVVKQILKFRSENRVELEPLLTGQFVDRVEVVMKETIGVKGRIDFYDQTGVVRDVVQNHLSELLTLVAMEMPSNISADEQIERCKMMLLKNVLPVGEKSLLIGQYSKYLDDAKLEKENISTSYYTPTFAAALLRINNPRWSGVPFLLVSGKHLEERSSYIRILFREREFCISGCSDGNSTMTKYPRQVIFQIGHGAVPSPGILVSRSLFHPTWPPTMKELSMTSKDSVIHGQSPGDFHYAVPMQDKPAYHTVLRDIYLGVRQSFVTTDRVLLLWNIWNDIIHKTKNLLPRIYIETFAPNLNFKVENSMLKFVTKNVDNTQSVPVHLNGSPKVLSIPGEFRNCSLVCANVDELMNKLAHRLQSLAEISIKERNVFHLALSGGTTPLLLFKTLIHDYPLFPWKHTHIWQVDERCVPQLNSKSNFLSIYENLLKFISIPYFNIHPMPTSYAGNICDRSLKGNVAYADLIKHLIQRQEFDLILLGIGQDGHTASLFPSSTSLGDDKNSVAYTQSKGGNFDRMSLLLPVINNAREIIVLVTGENKYDILQKIAGIESKTLYYPITYVSPTRGNLTWYIDMDAWTGL